ncbi:MAG: hypothetical protein ACRDSE_10120 [Pseudonocardiaceae bacterium]
MGKVSLRRRVVDAAEEVLSERQYVSLVDVLCGVGWIAPVNVDAWRKGRIKNLEPLLPVPLDRLHQTCEHLVDWAKERGLEQADVDYLAATRDRRPLTFLAGSSADDERMFRTHWLSPQLSPAEREKLLEKQNKAPDIVVFMPHRDWTCATCGQTDGFLVMENDEPLCLDCSDMAHLVFLPSGNAALTRRAKKASGLSAVVVRWALTRKRYERQGILVEQEALELAEEQCLADAEVRERRRGGRVGTC